MVVATPSCSPERSSAASPARAAARSMLGVDPRPRRIELDEPLEQRRLLRQPARGPLVQVVVAVDQARRGQAAGGVDALAVAGGAPSPTDDDPVALEGDVPVASSTGPQTVATAQPVED